MSTNFIIQPYDPRYKDQVIDLILNIQVGEFSVPVTIKDQPDLENIPTYYQHNNGQFWVALLNDQIIGTIALYDIKNQRVTLKKMFVAKEHRGKDKGVAQALLDAAINWCKQKHVKEIYLGTVAILHAAHRFYEKNNFIEVPKSALPNNCSVMEVDTKFYKYVVDSINH
jgi:GNAT superfamily N-acetyltransferase